MGIWAGIGVILTFPFCHWLWKYPQTWVDLCGKHRDPSKVMGLCRSCFQAHSISLSLFSVSALFGLLLSTSVLSSSLGSSSTSGYINCLVKQALTKVFALARSFLGCPISPLGISKILNMLEAL